MVSDVFLRKKEELFKKLKCGGVLTPELEGAVKDVYGGRGERALQAIKRRGVIKRGKRWFVRGKKGEYEVVKTFCTCRDYVLNIATEKTDVDMCYHALAKNLCEALGALFVLGPEKS